MGFNRVKILSDKNDGAYVDGIMVVCVDDVYSALNLYFDELKDEETLK